MWERETWTKLKKESKRLLIYLWFFFLVARGSVVGSGTMLQAGRSWV
jgi:hypothetical protein